MNDTALCYNYLYLNHKVNFNMHSFVAAIGALMESQGAGASSTCNSSEGSHFFAAIMTLSWVSWTYDLCTCTIIWNTNISCALKCLSVVATLIALLVTRRQWNAFWADKYTWCVCQCIISWRCLLNSHSLATYICYSDTINVSMTLSGIWRRSQLVHRILVACVPATMGVLSSRIILQVIDWTEGIQHSACDSTWNRLPYKPSWRIWHHRPQPYDVQKTGQKSLSFNTVN